MIDAFGRWIPDYAGQQPYQDMAYMRQNQPNNGANQQPIQMYTPPTIRAEIAQIDNISAIDKYPIGAGNSRMFMTKDEVYIVIRSVGTNGQYTDVIYEKKPPEPQKPPLNPDDYVRKDEISAIIADAIKDVLPKRTTAKKEEA